MNVLYRKMGGRATGNRKNMRREVPVWPRTLHLPQSPYDKVETVGMHTLLNVYETRIVLTQHL